jgi:hypothetical protein
MNGWEGGGEREGDRRLEKEWKRNVWAEKFGGDRMQGRDRWGHIGSRGAAIDAILIGADSAALEIKQIISAIFSYRHFQDFCWWINFETATVFAEIFTSTPP